MKASNRASNEPPAAADNPPITAAFVGQVLAQMMIRDNATGIPVKTPEVVQVEAILASILSTQTGRAMMAEELQAHIGRRLARFAYIKEEVFKRKGQKARQKLLREVPGLEQEIELATAMMEELARDSNPVQFGVLSSKLEGQGGTRTQVGV